MNVSSCSKVSICARAARCGVMSLTEISTGRSSNSVFRLATKMDQSELADIYLRLRLTLSELLELEGCAAYLLANGHCHPRELALSPSFWFGVPIGLLE